MSGRVSWLLLALLTLFGSLSAAAHPMPNSAVYLDFGQADVRLQTILPTAELRYAFGEAVDSAGARARTTQDRRLADYILRHIGATTPAGTPWRASIERLERSHSDGHLDIIATMRLAPPAGASVRSFTMRDDAVTHEVMSHIILVFARSDIPAGRMHEQPTLIGALQHPVSELQVNRPVAHATSSFGPAFFLGMRHIAEGTDHLLFLFALLLPAPLLASGGHWNGRRTTPAAVRHLAVIVSAFTLGHSMTLVVGALTAVRVPQAPIEVVIALSIMVAACQAWRPLFGTREQVIAFGFGLIHGLSFAAIISQYAMSPMVRAQAILGFNLGIETVQLALVLLVAPPLVWLAGRRSYRQLRLTGATAAAAAAAYWGWQRIGALVASLTWRADGSSPPVWATLAFCAVVVGILAIAVARAISAPSAHSAAGRR